MPTKVKAFDEPAGSFFSHSSCSCIFWRSMTTFWIVATAVPMTSHSSLVFSAGPSSPLAPETFLGLSACHFSKS
jgi:hypothetical protein